MSAGLDLQETMDAIWNEIADMRRRMANMIRTAKVKSYDPKTNTAKLDTGFDTHDVPLDTRDGDWKPMDKDQQVTLFCPDGDLANAFVAPGGYHEGVERPSQRADERVMSRGKGAGVIRSRAGGVAHLEVAERRKLRIKIGGEYFAIKAEALEPNDGD